MWRRWRAGRPFSEEAYQITRAASRGVSRVMFPVNIFAHVDDVEQACRDWFPLTMRVLSGR
eukprot:6133048-Lingulodinium_polyedra.AAC.1